jgi:hypothetical protein
LDQVDPPGPDSASNLGRDWFDKVNRRATHRRKTSGSSSRVSSATHANGRGSISAQPASSVVLPYPAGATMLANGDREADSRSITSDFATVPGRTTGTAILTSTRPKGELRNGHLEN